MFPTMTHESFTALLALVGIVIILSSLMSGAVERSGLPQVAIFLLLGAALGPAGLGLVELSLDSPSLQVIATLGLVLVLFSDAIGVDIGEIRQQRRLAALILGPGHCCPPPSRHSPPGCCSASTPPRPPSSAPRSPRPTRYCSAR